MTPLEHPSIHDKDTCTCIICTTINNFPENLSLDDLANILINIIWRNTPPGSEMTMALAVVQGVYLTEKAALKQRAH